MIRLAKIKDIKHILRITDACATHMISKGIYQWNNLYPNKQVFLDDINRCELYVYERGKFIVGYIVITTVMDNEYNPVKWLTPNANNIYIHRLAIHPESQEKGYARKLMDFAEQLAKDKKYSSIRLDTFSKNKRNQIFYELRGYKKLEEIYFLNQSKFPFYCYERVL